MKRCLVLLFSFMLLLTLSAFAQTGDVTVKINAGADLNKVFAGETNTVEYWITNAGPLKGMSIGFGWTSMIAGFSWQTPYGNKPDFTTFWIQEYGDAVGKFDLGGLQMTTAGLPDSFLIGGAALGAPLPTHAASTKLYDMKLIMPAAPTDPYDEVCGFTCNNQTFNASGTWKFDQGAPVGSYVPTFNGQPNTSPQVPDAPAVCFELLKRPCPSVAFTNGPGSAVNKNHCSDYSYDFDAAETPNQGHAITFSTSVGTINAATGQLTVPHPVSGCGTTDVVVTATSSCMSTATYPFTITWTNNNPSITNCPAATGKVGMGNTYTLDLNSQDADPCDAATWTVALGAGPVPAGTFGITNLGVFTFDTVDPTDGGLTFEFIATVTDPCGGTASCTFHVEVLATQPFIIKIEKTHNTIQGTYEYVSITKVSGSNSVGGFDFLLAYDASALSFFSAQLGAALGPSGLQWEYFTYRYGAQGNCGGPCPSGFLRVVGMGELNNGPYHPAVGYFNIPDGAELVSLKFYVTNDRTFECMYIPIRFAWLDCGDNALSSVLGDTLYISSAVFEFQNTDPLTDPLYEITGLDCAFPFHYGGACAECDVSGGPNKPTPVRFVLFWNGGVDIVCADSIDARGDINLNGIANEIADAVLFTNYFLQGVGVFNINYQGQVAATDINNDGHVLTVGDLVYLLRIIVGDALPFPKLAPFANSVDVTIANGTVSTESANEIGGVYATFAINGAYTVSTSTDMKVEYSESEGTLKVLVFSGMENLSNRLAAGTNTLFTVNGDVELKSIEVADYNGNLLNTHVSKTALPTSFALAQNVPNPFNPTTKIGLDLPSASDWSISIYNVAGQLVKSFNGFGQGRISVDADFSNLPSGVYFYKAVAGSFSDTKKMVLMK